MTVTIDDIGTRLVYHTKESLYSDKSRRRVLQNIPFSTVFSETSLLQYGDELLKSQTPDSDYQSLIKEIINLISNNSPKNPKPSNCLVLWNKIGHLLFTIGDIKAALSSYLKSFLFFQQKHDIYVLFGIGCICLKNGKATQGIILLQSVKKYLPENLKADALFRLGAASRITQNHHDSINNFESAKLLSNKIFHKEDILFQIAYTYQSAGTHKCAISILNKLSETFPNNISFIQQILFSIVKTNNQKEINSTINKGLSISINDPLLNLFKGRQYFYNHNYEEAILHYQKIISTFYKYSDFWCEIAGVMYFCKNRKLALEYLQKAITIDKTNQNAWLNIIYLTSLQDFHEFDRICKRAVEAVCDSAFSDAVELFSRIPAGLHWFSSEFNALIESPAEKWANQYLSSSPQFPSHCLGSDTDFSKLCGAPQSLVANNGWIDNPPFHFQQPKLPSEAFIPIDVAIEEIESHLLCLEASTSPLDHSSTDVE